MCFGGGGGGGGYQQPMIDDSAREAAQQAANKARDDAAAARAKFDNAIAAITTGGEGRQSGIDYFKTEGLDPARYMGAINKEVASTAKTVPDLDTNPYSYFGKDLWAGLINQLQTGKRDTFNRQVQSTFTPGYETTKLPDTMIDPIINDIMNTQRNEAQTKLDFAQKRGLLNDTGYSTALSRFGDQSSAAGSTLHSLGTDVLNKDRTSIADIVANAGNAANNWNLGMPNFRLNPYLRQVNQKVGSLTENLPGDVRAALGDTQLFDVPSLVAAGGTAQGPQDLTSQGASFIPKKQTKSRGLGSTGVF